MLTASDIMARGLITLRAEMSIMEAIRILVAENISGAPVIDEAGALIGMLSEYDCLRVRATGEYSDEDVEALGIVESFMSGVDRTIPSTLGIYSIADILMTRDIRRLPVVDNDKLVGQVSRRDVLRGIAEMNRQRHTKRYDRPTGPYFSATDTPPGVISRRLTE
jgi:CBS domain-containing protein